MVHAFLKAAYRTAAPLTALHNLGLAFLYQAWMKLLGGLQRSNLHKSQLAKNAGLGWLLGYGLPIFKAHRVLLANG
jgi:hypothetical protein